MKHVDMRKLAATAQEERRRQVIGLRQAGMTYAAIAAQVGLTQTGVFDICKRFAARGAAGLRTGPRGPEPGHGRFLDAEQEAETRDLIRRHTPDEFDLPFALWSRTAVRELIWRRFGVRLAVRTMGTYLARWGFTAQKPLRRAYEQALRSHSSSCAAGTFGSSARRRCGAGCGGTTRPSRRGPRLRVAPSSGATRPACAPMTCVAAATRPGAAHRRCGSTISGPASVSSQP
jgi:transposase